MVMGCDILTGRRVIKEHQIFNIILKTRGGRRCRDRMVVDRHNITEILLKVALNTITLTLKTNVFPWQGFYGLKMVQSY